MCGFWGLIGASVENKLADKLQSSLYHRGPDQGKVLNTDKYAFGFRRLSILDLSALGIQPMLSKDGKYVLIFNGEIYNYKELLNSLPEEYRQDIVGHSDSAVLLQYLRWKGEHAFNKLNGMFAFCFMNIETGDFYIVRDRFGVKPLFYSVQNNHLYFASELSTLLEFGFSLEINVAALNQYVRMGNVMTPNTIYNNIHSLIPGHALKGNLKNLNSVNLIQWYKLFVEENRTNTEKKWLDQIDELLFDATSLRLVADVPVGLFLSGGIDSSLVAAYASKSLERKPLALTIKFNETDSSEYILAEEIAKHLNLSHKLFTLGSGNLNDVEKSLFNLGQPFNDSSIINQFNLSEMARKEAIVFLTGDGGDEAFAGYVEYSKVYGMQHKLPLMSSISQIAYPFVKNFIADNKNVKQQLSKLALGQEYLGTAIRMNYQEPLLVKLMNKKYRLDPESFASEQYKDWHRTKGFNLVKRMQYYDYKNYLEPDVLTKVDRATMAHSIEARSPFLDYRIVELGLSIPTKFNLNGNEGKILLRKLAGRYLPESIVNAPKKGFGLPYRSWIDEKIKENLRKILKENNHDFWDMSKIDFIIKNADQNDYDYDGIFWRIWMFELWFKKYMDK